MSCASCHVEVTAKANTSHPETATATAKTVQLTSCDRQSLPMAIDAIRDVYSTAGVVILIWPKVASIATSTPMGSVKMGST